MQSGQPNYDFILNPQKPQKQPVLSGTSALQRAMIFGGLFVVLIIAAIIIISLFGKGSNVQKQRLIEIAQTQTEIIRITAIASDKSRDVTTRTLAATTRLTTESDKYEVMNALSARGIKETKDLPLSLGRNTKSDTLLEEATSNNRFDETYKEILTSQLESYHRLLQQAKSSGTAAEQEILDTASGSIELIEKSYQSRQ